MMIEKEIKSADEIFEKYCKNSIDHAKNYEKIISNYEKLKDTPEVQSMKPEEYLYKFIGMQLKNRQTQFTEGLKHIYTPTFEKKD